MRKKVAALFLAALLCALTVGCGEAPSAESSPDTPETVEPQGGEKTQPDAVEPPLPPVDPGPEPDSGDAWNVWEDWLLQGLDLMESESLGDLRRGLTKAETTGLLGEPMEKTEPEYWGADGLMHTTWTYDGAELSFTEDALEGVTVTVPFAGETKAGIRIGSSAADILAAYPDFINEEESTEERIVVGSVYGGLIFSLEDSVATQIFLGIAAE